MALLVANPVVLKKICPDWILKDFNGQLDFDCLIYDKCTTHFLKIELEPKLECFLSQGIPDNTDYIVAWTRGNWKVGKAKKGKRGYYELIEHKDGWGHYKLLIKSSEKSRQPKQILRVFCIDRVVKAELELG